MPAEFFDGEPKEKTGALIVGSLLAAARAELRRLSPAEAAVAVARRARLVETCPHFQWAADGEIPGAIVIECNHLGMASRPCQRSPHPRGDLPRHGLDRALRRGPLLLPDHPANANSAAPARRANPQACGAAPCRIVTGDQVAEIVQLETVAAL
ncbi:hypothetical protein ACQP25_22490 [Microtetraspora malaysiensis]|uniref:hypothetical protein n=1 Tax=Microtetraspora malaysiensis TaxID=161358 RepID=UPI003D8F6D32